jgi:hypothetical protein
VGYPSEAERRQLERFPNRVAIEDLRACFALSDADRDMAFAQRGAANRLGLAVALCAVRFLGFVPADLASVPEEALAFVASQVDAAEHGRRPRDSRPADLETRRLLTASPSCGTGGLSPGRERLVAAVLAAAAINARAALPADVMTRAPSSPHEMPARRWSKPVGRRLVAREIRYPSVEVTGCPPQPKEIW